MIHICDIYFSFPSIYRYTLSNSQSTNIPKIFYIDKTEGSRIRIVSETYNLIVVIPVPLDLFLHTCCILYIFSQNFVMFLVFIQH